MNRDIYVTLSLSNSKANISALEKINTNIVEIFDESTNDIENLKIFLSSSISKIEKMISGRIKNISVSLDPSKKISFQSKLIKSKINIVGSSISKKDIENLMSLTEKNNASNKTKIISIQPYEFIVENEDEIKTYSKAPIDKVGQKLIIKSSILEIDLKIYDYIKDLLSSNKLKLNQLLMSNILASFAKISKHSMETGSLLIDITNKNVNITLNKKGITIDSFQIYDFGLAKLIKTISKAFNCNLTDAYNLMLTQATFKSFTERKIYIDDTNIENEKNTNKLLNRILDIYLKRILDIIKKYLLDKNLKNIMIIFDGKINKISGINQKIVNNIKDSNVHIYKSKTFIEKNKNNINNLGMINFFEKMNETLGRNIDTIVHTNPLKLNAFIKKNRKQKILIKILNKLGVSNEWI